MDGLLLVTSLTVLITASLLDAMSPKGPTNQAGPPSPPKGPPSPPAPPPEVFYGQISLDETGCKKIFGDEVDEDRRKNYGKFLPELQLEENGTQFGCVECKCYPKKMLGACKPCSEGMWFFGTCDRVRDYIQHCYRGEQGSVRTDLATCCSRPRICENSDHYKQKDFDKFHAEFDGKNVTEMYETSQCDQQNNN
ncbi:uncharacterized protein LOC141910829 [Tubulanus polymorphus]|uniref:uncharacterized protein LOC141910829 n=1 Tax=Tubulanus polymorphus TaxID=672921 RepID=UPI003DA48F88